MTKPSCAKCWFGANQGDVVFLRESPCRGCDLGAEHFALFPVESLKPHNPFNYIPFAVQPGPGCPKDKLESEMPKGQPSRWEDKQCAECGKTFAPTGSRSKRCPACKGKHVAPKRMKPEVSIVVSRPHSPALVDDGDNFLSKLAALREARMGDVEAIDRVLEMLSG